MTKQLSELVINLTSYCHKTAKIRTRDVPDLKHLKDILKWLHELLHNRVFEDDPGRKLRSLMPVSENPLNQKLGKAVPFARHDCNTLAGFDAAPDYLAKSDVMLSCPELPPSAHHTVAEVPCSSTTTTTTPADQSVASGEASCSTAKTAVKPKPKESATQLREREKRVRKAHVESVFAAEESLQGKDKLWRPYLNVGAQDGEPTFGGSTRNSEPASAHTSQEDIADPFQALGARHEQEISQLQTPVDVAMEETPRKLGTKDQQCELSKVEQGKTRELLTGIEGEQVTVNKISQAAKRRTDAKPRGSGGKFKTQRV